MNKINRNYNHFCDEFVYELTSTHIPSWVNRTANIGSCCQCCIPQSFYDALFEVQTSYNNNNQCPSTSSLKSHSSVSSWLYQSSYLNKQNKPTTS